MIQIMAGTPQMKLLTTLLTASIVDNIDEISYHCGYKTNTFID